NDEAVAALSRDQMVFQRSGFLVRIIRDGHSPSKGVRRTVAARPELLPLPLLRERLSANARWFRIRKSPQGDEIVPGRPPAWCVAAVHARAHWPGIRPLEAVVEYPVLLEDGRILSTPGYDNETGLLMELQPDSIEIPKSPTRDDAIAARESLFE